MADYIIPGGRFEQSYETLAAAGWKLNLQSAPRPGGKTAPYSKVKFSCPPCSQNAWGKPELEIDCHLCGNRMLSADDVADRLEQQPGWLAQLLRTKQ